MVVNYNLLMSNSVEINNVQFEPIYIIMPLINFKLKYKKNYAIEI